MQSTYHTGKLVEIERCLLRRLASCLSIAGLKWKLELPKKPFVFLPENH